MLITNETDYALRILRALADGGKHKVANVCETESIPQQFAYKIIRKLSAGGIIQSIRGVNGGIQLTVDLHDITLLDIVDMTDSERYIMDCMRPGNRCTWMETNCKRCLIHGRLNEIQKVLDDELRKESLYELMTDQLEEPRPKKRAKK